MTSNMYRVDHFYGSPTHLKNCKSELDEVLAPCRSKSQWNIYKLWSQDVAQLLVHVSCNVSADGKYLSAAADESADCFPLNFGSWYWRSWCKNKPQNEPLFFTPFQQQLSIFLSHCCTKGITKYTPLPLTADTKLQRLRKKERQNSNAAIMVSLTNHNQLASIAWTCSKKSAEQQVNLKLVRKWGSLSPS